MEFGATGWLLEMLAGGSKDATSSGSLQRSGTRNEGLNGLEESWDVCECSWIDSTRSSACDEGGEGKLGQLCANASRILTANGCRHCVAEWVLNGFLHLLALAAAGRGRGRGSERPREGLAIEEVSGCRSRTAKVVSGRAAGGGGSECGECGKSAGRELTPCQEVSGSWHIARGRE